MNETRMEVIRRTAEALRSAMMERERWAAEVRRLREKLKVLTDSAQMDFLEQVERMVEEEQLGQGGGS